MRIFITLAIFFLTLCLHVNGDCPLAPANPEDRRTNRARLRAATFNAEWLFPSKEEKSTSPWTTPIQAEEHLADVAKAVYELNADVLALQEVYDCTILARLILKLDLLDAAHGYKAYLVQGTDTATGQNVALLTRIDPIANLWRTADRVAWPMEGNKCNYNGAGGTSAVSKHFVARFNISGVLYTFFNHHFLAYPTQADRCAQREAQASVMRGLINQAVAANDAIIAFGDYNDYSDLVPDAVNDIPNSRVMRILREGLLSKQNNNATSNTDPTLYEVSNLLPQPQRYTNAYGTSNISMIDHLLVSTTIENRILGAAVAFLYPRATTSDHWPFYVDFST